MGQQTLEEQLHLQRVFRLLTIEIPRKRIQRKLQKLDNKLQALTSGSREWKKHGSKKTYYTKELAKLSQTSSIDDQVYNRGISSSTLFEMYLQLGKPISKSQAEEFVWEVNDGLDGSISWSEYLKSYNRCKADRSGLEPSDLFFLVCFLMHDKECSGSVTIDEAMHIMFLKYGTSEMEKEMEALFGTRLASCDPSSITFSEYVDAVKQKKIMLLDRLTTIRKANSNNIGKAIPKKSVIHI